MRNLIEASKITHASQPPETGLVLAVELNNEDMKTEHTQGEWVAYEVPEYNSTVPSSSIEIGSTESSAWICKVQNNGVIGGEEGRANAKLIAASPLMLQALFLSSYFPITTEKEQAEAEEYGKQLGWKMDMPLENFAYEFRKAAITKATL